MILILVAVGEMFTLTKMAKNSFFRLLLSFPAGTNTILLVKSAFLALRHSSLCRKEETKKKKKKNNILPLLPVRRNRPKCIFVLVFCCGYQYEKTREKGLSRIEKRPPLQKKPEERRRKNKKKEKKKKRKKEKKEKKYRQSNCFSPLTD
jgi:hypothetical protein